MGHDHAIVGQLASGALTPGASEKAGELVFDLTSFVADPPEARQYLGLKGTMSASDQRSITRTMRGGRVLDSQQYPKATYTITSITPLDKQKPGEAGRYQFDGKLNLHGVEKPVRFEAKVERAKREGALQMRGRFALLQTDYGIKPYSFLNLKVKDELQIHGDLLLIPKKAE
jgi:polyisoprenoid-binding protein YceI